MARITGQARSTIYRGLFDICHHVSAAAGRIRQDGGGQKKKASQDPSILVDLKLCPRKFSSFSSDKMCRSSHHNREAWGPDPG
jgi:hypothetical protein